MKTKELIEILEKLNPEAEIELQILTEKETIVGNLTSVPFESTELITLESR